MKATGFDSVFLLKIELINLRAADNQCINHNISPQLLKLICFLPFENVSETSVERVFLLVMVLDDFKLYNY